MKTKEKIIEDWEIDFDKWFYSSRGAKSSPFYHRDIEIKKFICTKKAEWEKNQKQEIVEEIEKIDAKLTSEIIEKVFDIGDKGDWSHLKNQRMGLVHGWQVCIDQIKQTLNK